jgi:hypothetical protein
MLVARPFLAPVTIASAYVLAACSSPPVQLSPKLEIPVQPLAIEQKFIRNPDWGLALSGGGVRSGLYDIGVFKALYDQGALHRLGVVSSVSGGGYAAYWLLSNALANPQLPLGDAALSDDIYAENLCKIFVSGNVVTNGDYAMIGVTLGAQATEIYSGGLKRSFGADDPGRELRDFALPAEQGKIPYWIINTTLYEPTKEVSRVLRQHVVALTPVIAGSVDGGFYPWGSQAAPSAVSATTISGAAIGPILKQDVTLPRGTGEHVVLTLSDGGHSENLGVFSLVLRGVRNVIAIDSALDTGLKFGGYHDLKRRLAPLGINLQSEDIKQFVDAGSKKPARSIFKATATIPGRPDTTIYFVKMGLPDSLDSLILSKAGEVSEGRKAWESMVKTLDADKKRRGTRDWNCRVMRGSPPRPLVLWNLVNYRSEREDEAKRAYPIGMPGQASLDFPQYTTFDQSFYVNQSLAYAGLGYYQACEMAEHEELRKALNLKACR